LADGTKGTMAFALNEHDAGSNTHQLAVTAPTGRRGLPERQRPQVLDLRRGPGRRSGGLRDDGHAASSTTRCRWLVVPADARGCLMKPHQRPRLVQPETQYRVFDDVTGACVEHHRRGRQGLPRGVRRAQPRSGVTRLHGQRNLRTSWRRRCATPPIARGKGPIGATRACPTDGAVLYRTGPGAAVHQRAAAMADGRRGRRRGGQHRAKYARRVLLRTRTRHPGARR